MVQIEIHNTPSRAAGRILFVSRGRPQIVDLPRLFMSDIFVRETTEKFGSVDENHRNAGESGKKLHSF